LAGACYPPQAVRADPNFVWRKSMHRKMCVGCKAFERKEILTTAGGTRVVWTSPAEKDFACWLSKSLGVVVKCRDVSKRPKDRFFVVQISDEEVFQKIFAARFALKFEGWPVYVREWTLRPEGVARHASQPADASWPAKDVTVSQQ
jgi:hypothetical protein